MIRFAISLIAVSALFSGCFRLGIKGDGILKTEERSVSAFSNVLVAGAFEVQWSQIGPRRTHRERTDPVRNDHGKGGLFVAEDVERS